MASIILGAAGSAIGAAAGVPFGAAIGARFGQTIGRILDNTLLVPTRKLRPVSGPRLADLGVQTSTYGKMIPIVYGNVRIAGNIIWSLPIKETVTTTTSSSGGGGKGGGGKISQTSTTYSYSITLAIGICEGEIDQIVRVWADAKQLDLSQYTLRMYHGDEQQLPDSLIQSIEGSDKTPAYRGLSYIVFEDFPLADYGNRIPNFTFEVQKKALYPDYNDEILENSLHGMVMIPGAGEYVYDTQLEYKIPGIQVGDDWVQQGNQQRINMHNPSGMANALLSMDQLKDVCPNITWVAVVVTWFGDNMDAGLCTVVPGVEYQTGAITSPDTWQVGGFTRATARQITLIDNAPQYGGTPDDDSIIRYLDELKIRGYNIMFYPIMFMDVTGKPWRGDLTGNASDVSGFFTKTNGYNAFITHYANLVRTKVDAFVIGSELKGLTRVVDTPGTYPAVNELVNLAATIKAIVGSGVKVTYAADWSEYHHTDGGWYHMDPLWASPNIDFIGIDAYFPLTDSPAPIYDIDTVKEGWTSGEGYDWYYSDPERTIQVNLTPPYAWKNIDWFWSNPHVNPDDSSTAWVPQSKKIWFTEYGFPSVDGATNQPNVFYDPTSVSSAFPYYSKGRIDFRAQRVGLMATEQQWKDSSIVERMFVWTWDARPYPYWPDLMAVWADGNAWRTGHWVQGKLGVSSLAAISSDLCQRAGLTESDIDVSSITYPVEGFIINSQQAIRDALEILQLGYFFDTVESDYILKFVPRGGNVVFTVPEDKLVPNNARDNSLLFQLSRAQELELPRRINVVYLSRLLNYQTSTQYSQRDVTNSNELLTLDFPVVFSDQSAKNIADVTLFTNWVGRTTYQFSLPIEYARLEPADVMLVTVAGTTHKMRVTSIRIQTPGIIRVDAVAEDISAYDFYTVPGSSENLTQDNPNIPITRLELLDIPAFPADGVESGVLRMAGNGLSEGWTGAAVYRSDDQGENYGRVLDLLSPAAIGTAVSILPVGPSGVFDKKNTVTVVLIGNNTLQSVTELAVLNGANAAIIGNEILQFKTAVLVEPNKYILSKLLRGRLGTEWAIGTHMAGERLILLDGRVGTQDAANSIIGLQREYKAVTFGSTLSSTDSQEFTYTAIALKPYSPVHILGERNGSDDLTVSWIRRTRLGGAWQDVVDVPLNEVSEVYEVDIMNGDDVVRTISTTDQLVNYTATQQIADFGSVQPNIAVNVYQLSSIIGRGYPGQASV